MRYNITLVAGCRHKGAAQFGSIAEEQDARDAWTWLIAQLKERVLFAYKNFNAVTANLSTEEATRLLQDPRVLSVVPTKDVALHKTTQLEAPWHLNYLDNAANYTYDTTGEGVTVAVFDSGVDIWHTEFENRASNVFDAYNGIAIDSDHGTHVAGLVGGKTYGAAKKCSIISLRVLLDAGGTDMSVVAGIDWLLSNWTGGPLVANFSLGGEASIESSFLEDAILAMITDGMIVCISAGNESADASLYSPARLLQAITVGSVDSLSKLSSFSNFGPCVDILAPGTAIFSSGRNQTVLELSGTSMACPIVAGVAARILERQPDLTQTQVLSRLKIYCQSRVAILPPDELYTELNAMLPPEEQIPPKLYSLTTLDLVAGAIPGLIEGGSFLTLPGVSPFSNITIRPFVVINGEKTYGEPKTLSCTLGPAVVVHLGQTTAKRAALIQLKSSETVGLQPKMTTAPTWG